MGRIVDERGGGAAPRKRMLVTGGGGLLGREIFDRFDGEYEARRADVGECDVTDRAAVRREIEDFRPDVVIHCAAYTAVDRAEAEEALAFAVNAGGTRNVARECREHGAFLVTYGSDYVFDGSAERPYREDDAANPLSAYGRSKWAAEEALRDVTPDHLLIRTQWLYGAGGRNFVFAILDRAKRGEPLRVVSDQRGCPTSARDVAEATGRLLRAGARGTYHFSNEGEATWFDFASFIVARECPGPVDLSPARTADLAYPAPRPAYSVLDKERYRRATGASPRPWEEAVLDFLKTTHGDGEASR